jgi:hypothetical protein
MLSQAYMLNKWSEIDKIYEHIMCMTKIVHYAQNEKMFVVLEMFIFFPYLHRLLIYSYWSLQQWLLIRHK